MKIKSTEIKKFLMLLFLFFLSFYFNIFGFLKHTTHDILKFRYPYICDTRSYLMSLNKPNEFSYFINLFKYIYRCGCLVVV